MNFLNHFIVIDVFNLFLKIFKIFYETTILLKQIIDKNLNENLFIEIFSITFRKDYELFYNDNNVIKIIDFINLKSNLLNDFIVDTIE